MKPTDIANKIISQALRHEDAIETKISVATIAVGIEKEIERAYRRGLESRDLA